MSSQKLTLVGSEPLRLTACDDLLGNIDAGEFYAPVKVVCICAEICHTKEGMRMFNQTAGSGGMLIQTQVVKLQNPKSSQMQDLLIGKALFKVEEPEVFDG
ncbi:N-6 DNA methylase [Serratia microhaemolytica]|uniref:N-6 DNA methylase n=1 Tax=Serratia microhaemolytica TaxID=2675110 RepID=UPI000FDE0B14|nr:N-6 DNA methylase [Serratia microhaemolytica]